MHIPLRLLRTAASAAAIAIATAALWVPPADAQQSAHAMYTRALARERGIRDAGNRPTLAQIRSVIAAYESVVRRHPRSGYSDNALWQGGNLAILAFERFNQAADRRTAVRLLSQLKSEYPSSSLVARIAEAVQQLDAPRAARTLPPSAVAPRSQPATTRSAPPPAAPAPPAAARPLSKPDVPVAAVETVLPPSAPSSGSNTGEPAETAANPPPSEPLDPNPEAAAPIAEAQPSAMPTAAADGIVTIRDIRRTPLPDGVRVSIEMDGEAVYRSEKLENPRRLFFDIQRSRTVLSLQDATIRFGDEMVREIRLGRHPQHTTRIVMDLQGVEHFSVFTLYEPFRLIVDFHRDGPNRRGTTALVPTGGSDAAPRSTPAVPSPANAPVPLITRPVPPAIVPPAAPAANANGQFSIARQLGLGISRIVLDAGHGGHDPGARANGVSEAELVLDVTLRLRDLLLKQPGVEVILTRDKDVFVPLEERTAIANREGADLFLSIHANASRNVTARGIETYFLNFATNREAEAVAARENSASGKTMHSLPEIVRAIALNNKIDESRDFAAMVQQSMVRRLGARNKDVRDLGVKQAPFVVLIGAAMPSILAEISFVTHKQEALLLKSPAYRQQIAESLLEGILRYQRSLKGVRAVAALE